MSHHRTIVLIRLIPIRKMPMVMAKVMPVMLISTVMVVLMMKMRFLKSRENGLIVMAMGLVITAIIVLRLRMPSKRIAIMTVLVMRVRLTSL